MNKLLTYFIVMLCFSIGMISTVQAEIKVGVMDNRGALNAMKRWGNLGEYLKASIGTDVKIIPLKANKIVNAVSDGTVDYILTNPVLTLIIKEKLNAVPLATMKRKSGSQFSGVIFSKKGSGITKAEDLKGKKVMGFKFKRSAAAYVFQVKHLKDKGINPHKDFALFKEAKKQDDIVLAVKAGIFDAGFIKSGLLEAMEKEGKIKTSDFEIVDKQKSDGLTHLHSTALYPEWTISASTTADAGITKKIKAELLKLSAEEAASKSAKIVGFVEALSLAELGNTLKALKLPPYN